MAGCLKALARRDSSPWVLEGDIRGCFDNISHDWLLAHVPMDRAILRKWLKAGYMEKQVLHATEEGKPPMKPYVFELANGNPISFAGLWDAWKDKEGHWLQSFAIVTTEANELMSRVHPRMHVILHPRDYARWLDREQTEQLPVDLLRPLDSDEMEMFEANPKVGNVRNNGPELLRAAVAAAENGALPL